MVTLRRRGLTGLLAMLLMTAQSSPLICAAAVCAQRTSETNDSHSGTAEGHRAHAEKRSDEATRGGTPSKKLPLPRDCQVMALCAVTLFDPAIQFAETAHAIAAGAQPAAEFALLSRVAVPDTPPPRK